MHHQPGLIYPEFRHADIPVVLIDDSPEFRNGFYLLAPENPVSDLQASAEDRGYVKLKV
jgi:hypothetical protein